MNDIICCYSILDKLNGKMSFPFFQENDACAIREYKRAITKEMSADYELIKWCNTYWRNGFVVADDSKEVTKTIEVSYD